MADDKLPGNATSEIGSLGLPMSGHQIRQEWHRRLQGKQGKDTYRQMRDNSGILGGYLLSVRSITRTAGWSVERGPAADDQAEEAALWLEDRIAKLNVGLPDMMSEGVVTSATFGFCPFEVVYMADEMGVGWKKFAVRSPVTVDGWDKNRVTGEIVAMIQNDRESGRGAVTIPIEKLVNFRTETHLDNPEGRSLLRSAWRHWYYGSSLEEVEAIKAERDATGVIKITMPEHIFTSSKSEHTTIKSNMEQAGQQFRTDERSCIIMPPERSRNGDYTGWSFEQMSSPGASFDYDKTIRRHESRMLISVNAEFMSMGVDTSTSRSATDTKAGMFIKGLGALLDQQRDVFNEQAVRRLYEIDGRWDEEHRARIEHDNLENVDLEILGQFLERMMKVGGINPDDAIEDELRSLGNLPRMTETSAQEADDRRGATETEREPPRENTEREDTAGEAPRGMEREDDG